MSAVHTIIAANGSTCEVSDDALRRILDAAEVESTQWIARERGQLVADIWWVRSTLDADTLRAKVAEAIGEDAASNPTERN